MLSTLSKCFVSSNLWEHQLGGDAYAIVKFWIPDTPWCWYASEFDNRDTYFGVVNYPVDNARGSHYLNHLEMRRFTGHEMLACAVSLNCTIACDTLFRPTKLLEILEHRI